jgi:prevent-host-death family protein
MRRVSFLHRSDAQFDWMRSWQVQEAKARFSEFLEASKEGPQVVTKRGVETAVLVPIEQ